MRLGVLVSGRGSNLLALLRAHRRGLLQAPLAVVISNVAGAPALDHARDFAVPFTVIPHGDYSSRHAFEARLVEELLAHGVDWVVLAGFMRVLGPTFLDAFPGRIINIHPSLLPAFPGLRAQEQAYRAGARLAGCTVHLANDKVDGGPILAQAALPILEGEGPESLSARILSLEHRMLPQALERLRRGEAKAWAPPEAICWPPLEGPVVISACLLGMHVRYDGGHRYHALAAAEARRVGAVPVCPEVLGGLAVPRPPMAFVDGDGEGVLEARARLVDEGGVDRTSAMLKGAWRALAMARARGATRAILKARSPSCGCRQVWLGRTLVPGQGVTAALFARLGMDVQSEEDLVAP